MPAITAGSLVFVLRNYMNYFLFMSCVIAALSIELGLAPECEHVLQRFIAADAAAKIGNCLRSLASSSDSSLVSINTPK